MQEDGIGKDRQMETEPPRVSCTNGAKQGGEIRARWAWVEPSVWTDRMLMALDRGVKGGVWLDQTRSLTSRGCFALEWPMLKFMSPLAGNPSTGEPYAGDPHVRFGGRGRQQPLPTPIGKSQRA